MNPYRNLIMNMKEGCTHFRISTLNIQYLKAEHVYVKVFITGKEPILIRKSLKDLLSQLPANQFIQTHRSFAVNFSHVNHWDTQHLYIEKNAIPVSRSQRKKVFSRFNLT